MRNGSSSALWIRSAKSRAASAERQVVPSATNSSPPTRVTRSASRSVVCSLTATSRRNASPAAGDLHVAGRLARGDDGGDVLGLEREARLAPAVDAREAHPGVELPVPVG